MRIFTCGEKKPGESSTPAGGAAGDIMELARSCEKDLQSSPPSEKKLERRVMGPGLRPPLKRVSVRGGRVMVGRTGGPPPPAAASSFHGGRSPFPPLNILGLTFITETKKAIWKKEIKLQTLATFSLSVSCCLHTTNKGSKSFKHFCSVCLMVSCLRFFGCVGFGGSEREISKQKVHALVLLLWKRWD